MRTRQQFSSSDDAGPGARGRAGSGAGGEGPSGILSFTLVAAMTATTFQIFVFAVLASELIEAFDTNKAGLGILGSVNTLVGAVSAPASGLLTDKIGPRRSIVVALLVSGVGMSLMAVADSQWMLAAAAIVAGIPQGWGNPATNALIAERVPAGRRGTVTGIKQSGVQVAVFLAGLTLPGLAHLLGWRGAVWVYAGAFFLIAIVVETLLPAQVAPTQPGAEATGTPTPAAAQTEAGASANWSLIIRVALYAMFMGTAGGAVSRFFPLWAEEVLGFSTSRAGIIVAIGGLVGIYVRIAVGRFAEQQASPFGLLRALALTGAVYCLMLPLAPTVGTWIVWVSPLFAAVGIAAWNAVAMLAVITNSPPEAAGRASGVVMVGFLGGLTVGSPIAGWMIDTWDSYDPMYIGAIVLTLLSAAVMGRAAPLKWH